MQRNAAAFLITMLLVSFLPLLQCVMGPKRVDPPDETPEGIVILNEENFDSYIAEGSGCAVVEFTRYECKYCVAMAPKYDSIAMIYKDSLLVAQVDVDENMSLVEKYPVVFLPTFVFFSGDTVKAVKEIYPGPLAFEQLSELILALLNGSMVNDSIQ